MPRHTTTDEADSGNIMSRSSPWARLGWGSEEVTKQRISAENLPGGMPGANSNEDAKMKPHKHAAIIKAYADWAQVSETPWDIFQFQTTTGLWIDFTCEPRFFPCEDYRIKPRTININGFEVPEPVSEALENHTEYFKVELGYDELCDNYMWCGDASDEHWLHLGIIHLTKEAAQFHAKALLSFTKK